MINSFDIFDTLIARLCYEPNIIFEIIQNKYNLTNFVNLRKKYEFETKNFEKTYDKLKEHYNIDINVIKEYEIFLEYDLSIPINENINKICKDDILVSDMYLSNNIISKMLNKHCKIDNILYVSYGEKKNNIFWKNNILAKKINTHYGDNKISDYKNPLKYNINAVLIDKWLNNFEKQFLEVNKYISYIIRAVRISLDNSHFMTKLFTEYTLPFGIFICLIIKKKFKNKKVIFLSRDGYWFHKIYNILFNKSADYIYFSRKLVENSSDKFCKQINDIKECKVLIDLQGSGNTYKTISKKLVNTEYFLIYSVKDYDNYLFNLNEMNRSKFPKYSLIEQLFSAPHGSAYKYDKGEIKLLNPEYDINNLKLFMKGINQFSEYYKKLNNYIDIDKNYNFNKLDTVKNFILTSNILINFKEIKNYINHVKEHDLNESQLTFYSQIDQDKYFVEQIVNYKCNGVFFEAGGYDGITGSNTYFLEKNLNWNGILVECNPNMFKKLVKNRNCVHSSRALYEETGHKIKLVIPTGKDRYDGKEQLCSLEKCSSQNIKKFKNEFKSMKTIKCKTINIMDLFEENNIKHIDYFSLDIEGYELNILNTIDFDKINIDFFTIEWSNNEKIKNDLIKFMTSRNYEINRINKWDIEFKKTKKLYYILYMNAYLQSLQTLAFNNYVPHDKHYHGWFTKNNEFAINEALKRKPKVFCELGVWYGKSSEYILNNSDSYLISVDVWEQEAYWYKDHGVYDMVQKYPLYQTFLSNFYEFKDRLIPYKQNDLIALQEFYDNGVIIDAFYLDTTHIYQDTITELELIIKLYPNAFICGSDYTHSGEHSGCGKAIDEIAKKYNKKFKNRGRGWYYY